MCPVRKTVQAVIVFILGFAPILEAKNWDGLRERYGEDFVSDVVELVRCAGVLDAVVHPLSENAKVFDRPGFTAVLVEAIRYYKYKKDLIEMLKERMGWKENDAELEALYKIYNDGVAAGDVLVCASEVNPRVDYRYCMEHQGDLVFGYNGQFDFQPAGDVDPKFEFENIIERARLLKMKLERRITKAVVKSNAS